MSTAKSKLHDFHVKLCRYASESLAEHLDDVAFSGHDRPRYEALIEYVRQCGDDGLVEGPDMTCLLLNDDEFKRLSRWAKSLENSTLETPIPPPRRWTPIRQYHKLALRCVSEIKQALPGWEKTWSSDFARFMEEFESPNLSVADGIETCRRWANEVIRYQRELFREDLIPRPLGEFPTPTTIDMPTPAAKKMERILNRLTEAAKNGDKAYKLAMDEALAACEASEEIERLAEHEHIVPFIDSMRWAIRNGGDDSGIKLRQRVIEDNAGKPEHSKRGSNQRLCYLALDVLAKLGEHTPRASKARSRRQ